MWIAATADRYPGGGWSKSSEIVRLYASNFDISTPFPWWCLPKWHYYMFHRGWSWRLTVLWDRSLVVFGDAIWGSFCYWTVRGPIGHKMGKALHLGPCFWSQLAVAFLFLLQHLACPLPSFFCLQLFWKPSQGSLVFFQIKEDLVIRSINMWQRGTTVRSLLLYWHT